ncbi:MAG: SIS domain-containing protein [Blautia massiliensis (ex Durand et al. 2017)]
MQMVNFNEEQIIANGAVIYNQRPKIEAIADSIWKNGFDLLLFTSSGGSQAMLDPFAFYIRHMSRLPVESVLSANLMTGDCNRIGPKTVAFLTSKSGNTAETVEAARWLKAQGVRLFAAVGQADSSLESICDDTVVYGAGRPQEMIFYLLIGRLLYHSGDFEAYPRFADELQGLARALAEVRKQADEKCRRYALDYCKEPYNIWIGSGDLWPTAYSYSMCVLEESQWIRTKSVSSPEFFHGTLELLEDDVCTTLLLTEGPTRAQDERVKSFAARHTQKLTCFDTKDYELPGISDEFRKLLSPVVMAAVLQRISKNMEQITGHSLDIRRYYRKESY